MKLGFVYNAPCNILDVLQNPHDDASAYICYLAMQLAKIGNDVTIFSQNPHNVERGMLFLKLLALFCQNVRRMPKK